MPVHAQQAAGRGDPDAAFIDERRLPANDNTTTIVIDTARRAAEAESRRKADEQRVAAVEAESRRKADEQRVAAAEAESRRKAEDQRVAAAAEPPEAAAATPEKITAATRSRARGACFPAQVTAGPLPGGRVRIETQASCRSQTWTIRYGSVVFASNLNGSGHGVFDLDLFQGVRVAVVAEFGAGEQQAVLLPAVDLTNISKVAIIWQGTENIDLHAYEYTANHGGAGHVWSGAPATPEDVLRRSETDRKGHGFHSSYAAGGDTPGSRVQTYTFLHHPSEPNGTVSMAVDYVSRGALPEGERCGTGAKAQISLQVFVLDRNGMRTENQVLPAVPCGQELRERKRYQTGLLPDMKTRR